MDYPNVTQRGLTRTGRRAGCSCCSLTFLGLLALPVLALVGLFVII